MEFYIGPTLINWQATYKLRKFYFRAYQSAKGRDSSVGIATGYGLDYQIGRSSNPGGGKNVHFSMSSRPALGSTQPPIQWVPGALSPGESSRGVKLTTHLQLVPRSRKYESIHPLPHTPSRRSA
jgi:hypothetical protein